MPYKTTPLVFVSCDSASHPGDPIFKVEFRPAVSANRALTESGWTWDRYGARWLCPSCTRIEGR